MSTYSLTYAPDTDVLEVRRLGAGADRLVETTNTESGLLIETTAGQSLLVSVRIPDFSRRVDFFEIFEMFGEALVRQLAGIQESLAPSEAEFTSEVDPLASRDIRRQLSHA